MMKKLLEMSGYRVVEAVNGEEAVKVLRGRSCIILMIECALSAGLALSSKPQYPGVEPRSLHRGFCNETAVSFRRTERGCNA